MLSLVLDGNVLTPLLKARGGSLRAFSFLSSQIIRKQILSLSVDFVKRPVDFCNTICHARQWWCNTAPMSYALIQLPDCRWAIARNGVLLLVFSEYAAAVQTLAELVRR